MKVCLTNARIVLIDEVLNDASLLVEDGVISAINPVTIGNAEQVDLEGKLLIPGMIDLHCDALEKEVEPRPNVRFPLDFACAQADKRNAAAGITTVYHALSFANEEFGVRNNDVAAQVARAVHAWSPHGLVDNRVHCRYEITDETALSVLLELLSEDSMHMLSMMDHTPGQGQFKDLAAYRDYMMGAYHMTEEEVLAYVEHKLKSASGAMGRMKTLANAAHAAGIAVASHDDDTVERVLTMQSIGADISEFPISLAAAQAAKTAGMATIYGAPNIIRGKSQSGSMKAIDAIHEGVADCLCADYAPATLIVAVMQIPEMAGLDLAQAVRLVTANPAKAAKLDDRGVIEVGKRADLVAVGQPGGLPQITNVWVHGKSVYRVQYDHG